MITDKQKEFINQLLEERSMTLEELGWDEAMLEDEKFGKGRASLVIKELLSLDKE